MSDQRRCPTCSHKVPPQAKYCRHCGTPLGDGPAGRARPIRQRMGGQRRSGRGLISLLVLVLIIGATGGGIWYFRSSGHAETAVDISSNTIPGAPAMPDWLVNARTEVKTEYTWAASHLDELQYMPCYCGCGSSGHTDNFSCYFRRDGTGKIVAYDQMSFT